MHRRIVITRNDGAPNYPWPFTATLEALDRGDYVALDSWDGDSPASALQALREESLPARGVGDVIDLTAVLATINRRYKIKNSTSQFLPLSMPGNPVLRRRNLNSPASPVTNGTLFVRCLYSTPNFRVWFPLVQKRLSSN